MQHARERNLFAIEIPKLGSFIASGNWTAREIGLDTFPPQDRPPVLIPFFGFRIMVGMGLIMLAVSWFGTFLQRPTLRCQRPTFECAGPCQTAGRRPRGGNGRLSANPRRKYSPVWATVECAWWAGACAVRR